MKFNKKKPKNTGVSLLSGLLPRINCPERSEKVINNLTKFSFKLRLSNYESVVLSMNQLDSGCALATDSNNYKFRRSSKASGH